MSIKLGNTDATLAVGATPVRRVYRAGRLDFLRVTLGGSDYIISGVLYQQQGNTTWGPVVPLLTASPWWDNAPIADEMEPLLLELAAVPFPGVPSALPPENVISGIACGPAVVIGGPTSAGQNGIPYVTTGAARFYRADTGQVFTSTTYGPQNAPTWHLVGRPA
jgi:hypothetical protein